MICKKIVENLGGKIKYETDENGTAFEFTIVPFEIKFKMCEISLDDLLENIRE